MNREEFRKALDAEREIYAGKSPLPPWARNTVRNVTFATFVLLVASVGMIAFGFAWMALRILWWIIQ